MSLARVTTAVTAALLAVVAVATPASASTAPAAWPQNEDSLSMLEVLGLFGGGTLLLFVVIWGLAAAWNAKAHHHVVMPPSAGELEAHRQHDALTTH